MITGIIPQVQASVVSASIVKNILAGLIPSEESLSAIISTSKDVGGFEFDYVGEERLEAGVEITDHFSEDNNFMQDHRAIKPTVLVMRGFVAEKKFDRTSISSSILALSSSLAVVGPYIGKYSPGTAAKLQEAKTQTDQVVNQLAQILGTGASIMKLFKKLGTTKVRDSYDRLEALRRSQIPFAVVTPWATFGDRGGLHGPMMIENLVMVSPEDTRGLADIVIKMKEIRTAPSLLPTGTQNARGRRVPTVNGTVSAFKVLLKRELQ